jgi:DNA-directed RNA polymerase subunit RPC12/RpoP
MMGRLLVTCARCDLEFALRDNGYADPAATTQCPRCGSRGVRRREVTDYATESEPAA